MGLMLDFVKRECIPLNWDINISEIMENVVDECLVFLLSNKFYKGLSRELLAQSIRGQAILGESKVEVISDYRIDILFW